MQRLVKHRLFYVGKNAERSSTGTETGRGSARPELTGRLQNVQSSDVYLQVSTALALAETGSVLLNVSSVPALLLRGQILLGRL